MPGRAVAAHDQVDLRADDVPYLLPAFRAALAERAGMALRPQRFTVGVVVELDEVRPPPDKHGMLCGKNDPQRGAKALRPGLGRPQNAGLPVVGPRQGSHFAAAAEKFPLVDHDLPSGDNSTEISHEAPGRPSLARRPFFGAEFPTRAARGRWRRNGAGLQSKLIRSRSTTSGKRRAYWSSSTTYSPRRPRATSCIAPSSSVASRSGATPRGIESQ